MDMLVDTTFVGDILDNVLDDLVCLYQYCWPRVSSLLDRLYCFEPARAVLVYEFYCELVYMTKTIRMLLKLRRSLPSPRLDRQAANCQAVRSAGTRQHDHRAVHQVSQSELRPRQTRRPRPGLV